MLHRNIQIDMSIDALLGKCARLRAELAELSRRPYRKDLHAQRLSRELDQVEHAIAAAPQIDEQTSDTLPGLHYLYE